MFLPCQPQILCQSDVLLGPVLPLFHAVLNVGQLAQPAQILLFETQLFNFLLPLTALAQSQLPVIKPFIIGIPSQPPAIHAVLLRH